MELAALSGVRRVELGSHYRVVVATIAKAHELVAMRDDTESVVYVDPRRSEGHELRTIALLVSVVVVECAVSLGKFVYRDGGESTLLLSDGTIGKS